MSVKQATPKRIRVEGVPNLYVRPADGRYEVGYSGSDGRWHMKTIQATTLAQATRELRRLLGERDQNQDVAPRRLTLNEVGGTLTMEHARPGNSRPQANPEHRCGRGLAFSFRAETQDEPAI